MKKNNEKIGVKNPKILIAWDEKNPKNQGVDPKEINIRSNRISGWKCPNCGEMIKAHRVCPKCGSYKGKTVVDMTEKEEA